MRLSCKGREALFLLGGEGLELNLNNTVQIITIISFAAVLVKYLIVAPLQTAINALKEAITEMKNMISCLSDEQKCIDKRLVAVEESTKSAHKRIDEMGGSKSVSNK